MEKILATIYLFILFFLAMVYLFYQTVELIDRRKARKQMKAAREQTKPCEPEPVIDVVGKSTTAFLAPFILEKQKPLMSEDLKPEPAAETEPDILPDDVEVKMNNPYVPDDEELEQYANDDVDASGEFSQGLTFQQISHAIDVVERKKTTEDDELIAGETLNLMPSDFINMICRQADFDFMVKKLIAGYEGSFTKMKQQSVVLVDFDINKYV